MLGAKKRLQRLDARPARSRGVRHSGVYLWTHRRLLWRVAATEMRGRYAGSFLGLGWAVLAPALILAIYAVVYLLIFRVRVPGIGPVGYTLYIFAGLVPYLSTAEALAVGVPSVVVNKNVLSNTVFPIDLAPPKAVLLAQATMAVGLGATTVGAAIAGILRPSILLVPVLWLLMAMALVGLTWILSLLNVVFRDLQNLVTAMLMMLLVVSPIAYTPAMVPNNLRLIILFNPFAYYVTAFQSVIVLGQVPSWSHLAVLMALSLGLFAGGGWFFARTKAVLVDYV
jgi:lipopolysaccharide transport system permease protein